MLKHPPEAEHTLIPVFNMIVSLRKPLANLNLSPLSLLSLLPWLALLAWLASVAWFLTDDAFISFRYTRNLLEGHGLVFNPGERVEGYTNFLWILELAALWAIFDIRPEFAAPWLSVVYTAATITAVLWWTARLPSLQSRSLIAWMTLGLLCTSATFAVWTSGGGLETRQFTFFIVAAVVCLSLYQHNRTGLIAASLCLAAAELTRPEGLLLAACCFAWFALQRLAKDRSVNAKLVKDTACLVAPFALIVAAHFLFRYAYYGEWLPNTYYAKHVRPWYESGFRYLVAAAIETGLYLLLPLAFFALRSRWQSHRDGIYALSLLCVFAHMAYLLPIGGDHFEYRPLDFYWPLLALPAANAIALLGAKAATGLRSLPRVPGWAAGRQTYTIVLFLPILFYANAVQGALLFEGATIHGRTTFLYVKLDQKNAGWLLAAPGMPPLVAISNDLRRQSTQQNVASPLPEHRGFQIEQEQRYKPYEKMERGFIPDDALALDGGLGKFYYIPDLKVVDFHGLTDANVAHTPVTNPNQHRIMAHDRGPTPEYIKQRGVNFKIYPVASSAADALDVADFAVKFGPDLWMPFNAVNAQWATDRFAEHDLKAKNTFSTSKPENNLFLVGQHSFVGEQFLAHFNNGFDGWLLSGQAFSNFNQHANYLDQQLLWNRADNGFLTSYHHNIGNQATGDATSPTFTATINHYLTFLIAGGNINGVGLRLLADGEVTAVWRASSSDRFNLIVHPLGYVAGKTLQLQLFDYELGDNGHIMLDHLLLATCLLCPTEPPALALSLEHLPPLDNALFLVPGFLNHRSVEYHLRSHGISPVHVFPMNAPNLAHRLESALAAMPDLSNVRIVEWNSDSPWIDNDAQPLNLLLTKYGRFLNSHDYQHFAVYNYTDISFERPWSSYVQPGPLNIKYDAGITLQGLALGHDAEQLPLGQRLNLKQKRALWAVLQWQTQPDLDIDFVTSLRLYNADDQLAFQQDAVLWNPNHRPTSHWPAGNTVNTTAILLLPPELPPGDYDLRLVVYDFNSQVPTVQIDVWQPETTLARLRLSKHNDK